MNVFVIPLLALGHAKARAPEYHGFAAEEMAAGPSETLLSFSAVSLLQQTLEFHALEHVPPIDLPRPSVVPPPVLSAALNTPQEQVIRTLPLTPAPTSLPLTPAPTSTLPTLSPEEVAKEKHKWFKSRCKAISGFRPLTKFGSGKLEDLAGDRSLVHTSPPVFHVFGVPVHGVAIVRLSHYSGTHHTFGALLLVYLIVAVTCFFYDMCGSGTPILEPSVSSYEPTSLRWEFVRFAFTVGVVCNCLGYQLSDTSQLAVELFDPSNLWVYLVRMWPGQWLVCGFCYVSGVICPAITPTYAYSVVIGTFFCVVLSSLMTNAIMWGTLVFHHGEDARAFVLVPYYMWLFISLAIWQLTIGPIFAIGRKTAGSSDAVSALSGLCLFIAVTVASYILHHRLTDIAWSMSPSLGRLWANTCVFAPFFALGQILPRARWTELLENGCCQALAYAYFVIWHVPLFFMALQNGSITPGIDDISRGVVDPTRSYIPRSAQDAVKDAKQRFPVLGSEYSPLGQHNVVLQHDVSRHDWIMTLLNDVTLWFEVDFDEVSYGTNDYPHTMCPGPIGLGTFEMTWLYILLKAAVALSMVWMIGGPTLTYMWNILPVPTRYLASCGFRSLPCYLLHFPFYCELPVRLGSHLVLQTVPLVWYPCLGFVLGSFATLVLSSSLMERFVANILWLTCGGHFADAVLFPTREADDGGTGALRGRWRRRRSPTTQLDG